MLKIQLMIYQDVPKFMAMLASISDISGILPNLRFHHQGTYEYEANLFLWIIAKYASGKNVSNDISAVQDK